MVTIPLPVSTFSGVTSILMATTVPPSTLAPYGISTGLPSLARGNKSVAARVIKILIRFIALSSALLDRGVDTHTKAYLLPGPTM
jgi:hypothetical protein